MSAKDVGVRIRVEKGLRDAFQAACTSEERVASDVLREFMRQFAEQHSAGRQKSLFVGLDGSTTLTAMDSQLAKARKQ